MERFEGRPAWAGMLWRARRRGSVLLGWGMFAPVAGLYGGECHEASVKALLLEPNPLAGAHGGAWWPCRDELAFVAKPRAAFRYCSF